MNDINYLHKQLSKAGIDVVGVSDSLRDSTPDTRRVDFAEGVSAQDQTLAHQIADGHGRLSPAPVEAVIPISTASVPSTVTITVSDLTTFDFVVFEQQDSEWIQVADGTINDGTLEFESFDDGRFLIEVSDGFLTGYSEIEVTA